MLSVRTVEGNHIGPEGIEDSYVFAPGARLEVVDVDGGRQDLERPVKQRTWIRVSYPDPLRAPCDGKGGPVEALVAGVNVDDEGLVLKASVIGNLDIVLERRQAGSLKPVKRAFGDGDEPCL